MKIHWEYLLIKILKNFRDFEKIENQNWDTI